MSPIIIESIFEYLTKGYEGLYLIDEYVYDKTNRGWYVKFKKDIELCDFTKYNPNDPTSLSKLKDDFDKMMLQHIGKDGVSYG